MTSVCIAAAVFSLKILPHVHSSEISKPAAQALAKPSTHRVVLARTNNPALPVAFQAANSGSPYAFIYNPVPPPAPTSATTFKNGTSIIVTGYAAGTGFQSFMVDWAPGLDPAAGWQTSGVALAGGGTSPVTNGTLATWDTSSIGSAGFYTMRLTVNVSNTPYEALTMVYLEPDLLSSKWPQLLSEGSYFSAGVIPALNTDGTFRLVVESPAPPGPGRGNFFNLFLDGTQNTSALLGFGSFQQPAVADFETMSSDQAVVADERYFFVYQQDGTGFGIVNIPALDYTRNQVLLEDLANNSHWEAVALGSDYNTQLAYVFAWDQSGSNIAGNFPIQVPDQNPVNTWYNRNRVLVGDLRGDGKKEIVIQEGLSSTTFTLGLFANDGTPLMWNVPVLTGMPEAMAAADLDHDDRLETILVLYAGPSSDQAIVHVFQPDGSERPGWPVTLPNPDQYSQSFLAIGDLKQDGHYEIVYSHEGSLYVFKDNGTLLSGAWPLQAGSNVNTGYGSVVIGDIDGDGFPEIVTTLNTAESTTDPFFVYGSRYYDEKLLAIRADGTISKQWQLTASNGYSLYDYPAPAIGDFNQDGITDIAVAYEVTGSPTNVPGIVTILSTGTNFNPALNNWPLTHHDPRNTGVLLCSDFCLSASTAPPVDAGFSASYAIKVTPNETPYNFAVTNFTCSGLPSGATCSFSPSSVTPGNSNGSTTLSIGTTSRTLATALPGTGLQLSLCTVFGAGFFGLLRILIAPGERNRNNLGFFFGLILLASLTAVSCGAGSPPSNPNGTPAGSYAVTVTATGDSGVPQSTKVSLNVN